MKYNILAIDDESQYNLKNLLKQIKDTNIILANDETTLTSILEEKSAHIIVVNTDIMEVEVLLDLLQFDNHSYNHIPIIALGTNEVLQNDELPFLIFDCTNDTFNQQIVLNLINYCKELYTKELLHESKIVKLLYNDRLTQLDNRVKLIKDLQDENIHINALALLDINGFKDINDFFGHRVGDKVLKTVTRIILRQIDKISKKTTLYKLSGDVFCIANYELSFTLFEELIIYLLGAIESAIIKENGYEIDLRATAGISFSTNKNKLITADLALHSAKKQHKNFLVFYDELDYLCEYEKNMLWAGKLKKALKNDNICVYYQPIISARTMKVVKYECLVRMFDVEEQKIISPSCFLEVAKKSRQYFDITKIVIEKAFQTFHDSNSTFSINISYRDIEEKSFLKFIEKKLDKYNVADKIVWEILENEEIQDYKIFLDFIYKVKKMGCKVSLDDFGTGYSNFEHILKMDLDYLKIDASLVKMVAQDPNSYKIVKTIVKFAKTLGILTIAEFVENEEIYKLIKTIEVDFYQGYYFSKPKDHPSTLLENNY